MKMRNRMMVRALAAVLWVLLLGVAYPAPTVPTPTTGLTATKAEVDLKAPLAGPTFTGTPVAPTASAWTNTTQLATTAFVQTMATNMTATYNVLAYGAVANDGTDDSTAVQAAITAAGSSGIVYFPAGTYKVNLTLGTQAKLMGAGSCHPSDGTPATTLQPNNTALPVILISVAQFQSITNLNITGPGKASSTSSGIQIGAGTIFGGIGYRIDRVFVSGFDKGLYLRGCIEGSILSSTFAGDNIDVYSRNPVSNDVTNSTTFQCCAFGGMNVGESGTIFDMVQAYAISISNSEMGNKTLIGEFDNCQVSYYNCNCESVVSTHLIRSHGSRITWDTGNVQCGSGTATASLVRANGDANDSSITLRNLKVSGFTNYGSFGAPLGVETLGIPNTRVNIENFAAVLRVTSMTDFSDEFTAYVPTVYINDRYVYLAADVASANSTTLADVSGLSVSMPSFYRFHVTGRIYVTHTANSGSKLGLFFTGGWPADRTEIRYGQTTVTVAPNAGSSSNALVGGLTATSTSGTGSFIEIDAIIVPSSAGTLTVRVAKNATHADATTVLKGSFLRIKQIPY